MAKTTKRIPVVAGMNRYLIYFISTNFNFKLITIVLNKNCPRKYSLIIAQLCESWVKSPFFYDLFLTKKIHTSLNFSGVKQKTTIMSDEMQLKHTFGFVIRSIKILNGIISDCQTTTNLFILPTRKLLQYIFLSENIKDTPKFPIYTHLLIIILKNGFQI